MIKKLFILIIIFTCMFFSPYLQKDHTLCQILTGTVTAVPEAFYGTWRVKAKLVDTDSPLMFKENNIDLWNLSRLGDVITLSNPFNGAEANITINSVKDGVVTFTKNGKYGSKILTDIVQIKLENDCFEGTNTIKLDTYSDVNGKIMKTETAKYSIKGEKIAGNAF